MALAIVLSIAVGIVTGLLVAFIWNRMTAKSSLDSFWRPLTNITRSILSGEDEEGFFTQYWRLIKLLIGYVSFNLLCVAVAILPVIMILMLAAPAVRSSYNAPATYLDVYPAQTLSIEVDGNTYTPDEAGRIAVEFDILSSAKVTTPGGVFDVERLVDNHAASNSLWMSLVFSSIDFNFEMMESPPSADASYVIVRPGRDDGNPFFPFFNDLEFAFFLSLCSASMFGIVFLKIRSRKKSGTEGEAGLDIRGLDYLWVEMAYSAPGLWRVFGNMESWFLKRKLKKINIKQPVFVTGLARAGTTTLLESLAKIKGVATHRYRDFPFLMMPCLWNLFVRLFNRKQAPVDRPHKDRIKISPESPEAFEEPLWQSFFDHVHDPNRIHVLDASLRSASFDDFFPDHLRKVMRIRRGERYVSKGNYNLTRIEYLVSLFPDAKFVIPVRHPIAHVHSLVRQHELFTEYAETDSRVPRFLKAAGHYEFGPQRVPILFSEESGQRINAAWNGGDEYAGYAIQWSEVYRYVHSLSLRDDAIGKSILIVRYEDFCEDPQKWMSKILEHTNLLEMGSGLLDQLDHISKSPHRIADLPEDVRNTVWHEAQAVAEIYGYSEDA